MWTFRAIQETGVYWSLTISRARRDGERDRRCAAVPCGLWTPADAHRAVNSPQWHGAPDGATPARWTAAQRAALRAGLNHIALRGSDA